MKSKLIDVAIMQKGSMCAIPVPFDPRDVFGKVRVPVKVTLRGYTYRSTIARMGGTTFIPLRRSNAEAAGVKGGERVRVRIALDEEKRVVKPPADLSRALKSVPGAWKRWQGLSYTLQREGVEAVLGARQAATRSRRIARIVASVTG